MVKKRKLSKKSPVLKKRRSFLSFFKWLGQARLFEPEDESLRK
jgi:hypothetical protein